MELKGFRSKLTALQGLVDKLEQGNLSLDELVEMERVTRELHERSLILKYKAFEEKVGVAPAVRVEPEVEIEAEIEIEQEIVVPVEEPEEEPIEFSIFDDETEEEESTIEEEQEEEPAPMVMDGPEIEEHTSITVSETHDEGVQEVHVEVKETKEVSSFLDKYSEVDNSLASQFSGRKLDTLIGAFGLNERLRFINNLFDGSSELFSEAIKVLDSQNSMEEAAAKVATYAEQHEWEPEEENVMEFMTYLKRRYA
jgi:hypothetical protein